MRGCAWMCFGVFSMGYFLALSGSWPGESPWPGIRWSARAPRGAALLLLLRPPHCFGAAGCQLCACLVAEFTCPSCVCVVIYVIA
jgi:hypothetical protein